MGFYQFFVQNALVLGKLVRIMFTIFIFIKVKLFVALPGQCIRSRISSSVLLQTAYVKTQFLRDCIANTRTDDGIQLGSFMPAYLGSQTLRLLGGQET